MCLEPFMSHIAYPSLITYCIYTHVTYCLHIRLHMHHILHFAYTWHITYYLKPSMQYSHRKIPCIHTYIHTCMHTYTYIYYFDTSLETLQAMLSWMKSLSISYWRIKGGKKKEKKTYSLLGNVRISCREFHVENFI